MEFLTDALAWFADPVHWRGTDGVPARMLEHLYYSGVATLVAVLLALPAGLAAGHTGRGGALAVNVANAGRALPTFGLVLLVVTLVGLGDLSIFLPLVAFAVPPILTNAYAGIRAVDPDVRDAAAGVGMTGLQVLWRVELPVALPLVLAGIRTSAVQVVATATLAAYAGSGGLGRYIVNGFAVRDFPQVFAGALLVALFAIAVELAFGRLQALVVPKGVAARLAEANADAKMTAAAA
ncbi:MAG TPA: ABC transporter permease [Egibacteraceae bacterium]|jgi:osmoprotectant transport system permease protein|nr:ABC transporter permease [Egibacteraceae bacterium]